MSEFSASSVKCSLQIANCCAVSKINKYITDQQDGKRCEKDFDDAELMFSLIDSLRGFIPEGDLISGTQASESFTCTLATIGHTVNLQMYTALGVFINQYVLVSTTTNTTDFVTYAAGVVNSFYPHSYPYHATTNGNILTITGSNFQLDNLSVANPSFTFGQFAFTSSDFHLTGGTPPVYQGPNCLTNQQAQNILSKLKSLCGC